MDTKQIPTNDGTTRAEEMMFMRFQQGMTLREIGNFYGISRERVRQIIGNTGWTQKPKEARNA